MEDTMGMLTDWECILLETENDNISILNLKTHEFKKIPFKFVSPEYDQAYVYVFPETKYFCIQEVPPQNKGGIKLSYFSYPFV